MERAASLLVRLQSKNLDVEDLARAAWPKAIGPRLEKRARVVNLVRSTLVIEVEDAVWQRQLHAIRAHILANINELLGAGHVTGLEFRIGVPRRPAAREMDKAVAGPLYADEADRIADPVLRKIYRQKRRAAGE